jgi:DNA-binding GntR family transcriptional regulator
MLPSIERHANARTVNTERADPSYWTAYDRDMIEREARAMRRAYIWSSIARGWRALRAGIAAIAGARRSDGHRSARRLSPRT